MSTKARSSSSLDRLTRPTSASQRASKVSSSSTSSVSGVKRSRDASASDASTKRRALADRTKSVNNASNRTLVKKPSVTSKSSSSGTKAVATKTKRPPWDVKGRLQDLESFTTTLKTRVNSAEMTVAKLQAQLQEKEETVSNLTGAKDHLQEDLGLYQKQAHEAEIGQQKLMRLMDQMKTEHQNQLREEEQRRRMLQMEHDALKIDLQQEREEHARAKHTVSQQNSRISSLEKQLQGVEEELERSQATCEERAATIAQLEDLVQNLRDTIDDLEKRAREDEMERRKLHNTILELKGNIRVFCRIRPYLQEEMEEANSYEFPDSTLQKRSLNITLPASTSSISKSAPRVQQFQFDRVFAPHSTQGEVFTEIAALVQSALDGYHVCIFTYGQTGSGKTYTMEGPANPDAESRGMIPRAVEQIFECTESLKDKGWSYKFSANYLEIYNESIRDLLAKSKSSNGDHKIQHDKNSLSTSVTNLTYVNVVRPSQIHELLTRASSNRATAKTECNDRSSRSHSVFQLRILGENSVTGEKAEGLLNLVDLAGSERLKESKATGDRLKETQNINKSLSCLGDVIAALANKDNHIPYRNSKLTYLLQNSLGGNSKTLMFVNISPATSDLNESINSLRFATKVNACDIGVARKGGKHDLHN